MISQLPNDADNQFYPTPKELAYKMMSKALYKDELRKRDIQTVLEPSAGKGDLIFPLLEGYNVRNVVADCIEADMNLQSILRSKIIEFENDSNRHNSNTVRIIYDDFLKFNTWNHYDLILMNPPFANGDEHLIKAIRLALQNCGSMIVCILNAETIRNPYTKRRKALKQILEKLDAEIEFVENAFANAERPTSVDIAIVSCEVKKEPLVRDFLQELQKAHDTGLKNEQEPEMKNIVSTDPIEKSVQLFNYEICETLKVVDAFQRIEQSIQDNFDSKYSHAILQLRCEDKSFSRNMYVHTVRRKYWERFFKNPEFTGMLTSNLQSEFYSMVSDLVDYDYNLFNIKKIIAEMAASMQRGLDETILSLFDKLSAQHSWCPECAGNIHYYNGWATNKAHKIGMKVIIPLNAFALTYDYNRYHHLVRKTEDNITDYKAYPELNDIEKTLNYLDMGKTGNVDLSSKLNMAMKTGKTKKIQCKYFSLDFYKKGTCHITFHPECEKLIEKFNIFGSQKKGWLPPSYGKKHYADMTEEEKVVIDEFSGKDSYEEVLAKSDYYLVNTKLLMLPESEAAS